MGEGVADSFFGALNLQIQEFKASFFLFISAVSYSVKSFLSIRVQTIKIIPVHF